MESQGFLAFDVETPDASNARICQIGCVEQTVALASVSASVSVQTYGFLVNPECDFYWRNIQVHGITADDVAQEPTFAQIWENGLAERFRSHILVAHNARFDMTVLSKTLESYGIEPPQMSFVDTLQVARRCYPQLPNHKLDTVSNYLGVSLEHHHDASSDAFACYGILMESIRRFGADVARPRPFVLSGSSSSRRRSSYGSRGSFGTYGSYGSRGSDSAHGSRSSYGSDSVNGSYNAHGSRSARSGSAAPASSTRTRAEEFDPINHDVKVTVNSHVFVLTGDFSHMDKNAIKQLIQDRGGEIKNTVSGKVDYVVRGSLGSARWNHGSYGTKVEKAVELQKKGSSIHIVDEKALFAALEC